MTIFDEIAAQQAADAFRLAGVSAVYTPLVGNAVNTYVKVAHDLDMQSLDSFVVERVESITFLLADIPSPQRGDTVRIGADLWTVKQEVARNQITSICVVI